MYIKTVQPFQSIDFCYHLKNYNKHNLLIKIYVYNSTKFLGKFEGKS